MITTKCIWVRWSTKKFTAGMYCGGDQSVKSMFNLDFTGVYTSDAGVSTAQSQTANASGHICGIFILFPENLFWRSSPFCTLRGVVRSETLGVQGFSVFPICLWELDWSDIMVSCCHFSQFSSMYNCSHRAIPVTFTLVMLLSTLHSANS